MKKVNFKTAVSALVLALVFLFLGTERVGAQSAFTANSSVNLPNGGKGIYALPQGNFVDSNEALDILTNELLDVKNLLLSLPPGALYNATNRQYIYYNSILAELLAGKSVPDAIVYALVSIDPDTIGGATPAQQQSLKQSAIDLLSI